MSSMDNGIVSGLGNLPLISTAQSRSISGENSSGAKGEGSMATEGTNAAAAKELGKGWKVSPSRMVMAGQTVAIADIKGSGAIQSMWFGSNINRNVILRIYWDYQDIPSVECPLGDFFAYGWAKVDIRNPARGPFYPISSLAVAVNPNIGMNCFWCMPFRKHCRISIENRNVDWDYNCYHQINYTLTEIPETAAYFHSQFRMERPVAYKKPYTPSRLTPQPNGSV